MFTFLSKSEAFNLQQGHSLDLGEGFNCCDLCKVERPKNSMWVLKLTSTWWKCKLSSVNLFFNLLSFWLWVFMTINPLTVLTMWKMYYKNISEQTSFQNSHINYLYILKEIWLNLPRSMCDYDSGMVMNPANTKKLTATYTEGKCVVHCIIRFI